MRHFRHTHTRLHTHTHTHTHAYMCKGQMERTRGTSVITPLNHLQGRIPSGACTQTRPWHMGLEGEASPGGVPYRNRGGKTGANRRTSGHCGLGALAGTKDRVEREDARLPKEPNAGATHPCAVPRSALPRQSAEGQQEYQYDVDEDQERQHGEDHHALGAGGQVAAQQGAQGAPGRRGASPGLRGPGHGAQRGQPVAPGGPAEIGREHGSRELSEGAEPPALAQPGAPLAQPALCAPCLSGPAAIATEQPQGRRRRVGGVRRLGLARRSALGVFRATCPGNLSRSTRWFWPSAGQTQRTAVALGRAEGGGRGAGVGRRSGVLREFVDTEASQLWGPTRSSDS
uniref:Uncharacterized protein n=1 Tax=Mustela putorius furo TaxID=9669 RepID=M3Z6K6_MUSPF